MFKKKKIKKIKVNWKHENNKEAFREGQYLSLTFSEHTGAFIRGITIVAMTELPNYHVRFWSKISYSNSHNSYWFFLFYFRMTVSFYYLAV